MQELNGVMGGESGGKEEEEGNGKWERWTDR